MDRLGRGGDAIWFAGRTCRASRVFSRKLHITLERVMPARPVNDLKTALERGE
jgi:hypothetical protein